VRGDPANSRARRWIAFQIWSVPNGRKATVTNTVIQPGERAVQRTVKDPTKSVGYRFFNWRKRYFSNYPAVDGVTVVGTRAAS
jgi:hypothetical protein